MNPNPYEPPIVAELADRPRRKRKPLPVVAIGLLLFCVLLACVLVAGYSNHPVVSQVAGASFTIACVGTIAFMVAYELYWWFVTD